jgi:hypothetical protein
MTEGIETTTQGEPKKFKCLNCNEVEFDTALQLRGHQMKCRPRKQERVPFGLPEKRFADVPSDDGFYYRIFNDNWKKEPGRVKRALKAGYEIVDHFESGGNVGTNDDGTEIKGVLMRIPKELYEQDQAAKEGKRMEVDKQIYRGKFEAGQDGGRYLPGKGIRSEVKSTP